MVKRNILIALLITMTIFNTHSVRAQGSPESIYVDRSYVGMEEGTKQRPYNTMSEAYAVAKNLADGGLIYLKQLDGTWSLDHFVSPIVPGVVGETPPSPTPSNPLPISLGVIYTLVAVIVLGLMLFVWQFQRRLRR